MQVIHFGVDHLPKLPDIALTIGNYDGVHLGHQAMLTTLLDAAKQRHLQSAVMIFEPQPREFFNTDVLPARLTALHEKTQLFAKQGVDYVLVAKFNDEFRRLSADEFTQVLIKLNVQHLVLGDDFRFGQDRLGDDAFLNQANFSVQVLPTIVKADHRISSTAIRQALQSGDLTKAQALLGRPYSIMGKVVHGDKIGRTLDFPTANIALNRLKPSVQGVFAADVLAFCDDKPLDWQQLAKDGQSGIAGVSKGSLLGAVNVGTRPSVNGVEWRLEVHLPDFAGDLYDVSLQVIFLHYLHGERRYNGLDALKQGIKQDVADVIAWRANVVGLA